MDNPNIETMVRQGMLVLADYSWQLLAAIIILVAGRIVAGLAARTTASVLKRNEIDESLIGFAGGLIKGAVIAFAAIAALARLGVQTASFVAVVGAAGLAVGLALQGSLSNFAAGVLILLFRPFRVGDAIDSAGSRGKVKEIGILTTTLATPDNQKVILPNAEIMSSKIVNINAFPTRRVDLMAGIGYDDDIDQARDVLRGVMAAHPKVLKDPEPVVEVMEMADSSVNLVVRPWVNTADYWEVFFDLNRSIKLELERNGLSIPFPQRDVHLFQAGSSSG